MEGSSGRATWHAIRQGDPRAAQGTCHQDVGEITLAGRGTAQWVYGVSSRSGSDAENTGPIRFQARRASRAPTIARQVRVVSYRLGKDSLPVGPRYRSPIKRVVSGQRATFATAIRARCDRSIRAELSTRRALARGGWSRWKVLRSMSITNDC